ncbi:MAG: hypothetical protein QM771_05525 [Nitrospira sp.]
MSPSSSHPGLPHDHRSIEQLTIQALNAARAGDWDQVTLATARARPLWLRAHPIEQWYNGSSAWMKKFVRPFCSLKPESLLYWLRPLK